MASDSVNITRDEFAKITKPLEGMMLREPRLGIAHTLLAEIGKIRPCALLPGHIAKRGQAGLMIEPGWRVESRGAIVAGSDSGDSRLARVLRRLDGMRIAEIGVEGVLPELYLWLDSGWTLRSFRCLESRQAWCVFLNDESLFPKRQRTPKKFGQWVKGVGNNLKLEWAHGRNPYTCSG
jgi:hypothetical protein